MSRISELPQFNCLVQVEPLANQTLYVADFGVRNTAFACLDRRVVTIWEAVFSCGTGMPNAHVFCRQFPPGLVQDVVWVAPATTHPTWRDIEADPASILPIAAPGYDCFALQNNVFAFAGEPAGNILHVALMSSSGGGVVYETTTHVHDATLHMLNVSRLGHYPGGYAPDWSAAVPRFTDLVDAAEARGSAWSGVYAPQPARVYSSGCEDTPSRGAARGDLLTAPASPDSVFELPPQAVPYVPRPADDDDDYDSDAAQAARPASAATRRYEWASEDSQEAPVTTLPPGRLQRIVRLQAAATARNRREQIVTRLMRSERDSDLLRPELRELPRNAAPPVPDSPPRDSGSTMGVASPPTPDSLPPLQAQHSLPLACMPLPVSDLARGVRGMNN